MFWNVLLDGEDWGIESVSIPERDLDVLERRECKTLQYLTFKVQMREPLADVAF